MGDSQQIKKEKIRKHKIRHIMNIQNNIVEETEERRVIWLYYILRR